MRVKEESKKVGLKFNIQICKIMASSPITAWQIDGKTVEAVPDFIFFCSKITADGDCSHEIKRCLFLGRKVMMNLDSILKSRDITFPPKVHPSSQSYDLSSSHIWMWELDYKETLWPSNPIAGHTHWGNQNWKRHMYPNVHRSTVYSSQDMETT